MLQLMMNGVRLFRKGAFRHVQYDTFMMVFRRCFLAVHVTLGGTLLTVQQIKSNTTTPTRVLRTNH